MLNHNKINRISVVLNLCINIHNKIELYVCLMCYSFNMVIPNVKININNYQCDKFYLNFIFYPINDIILSNCPY